MVRKTHPYSIVKYVNADFIEIGTLDSTASEDYKDSKYGSSSTMSVGSDASPGCERRQQQKAKVKLTRPQVN